MCISLIHRMSAPIPIFIHSFVSPLLLFDTQGGVCSSKASQLASTTPDIFPRPRTNYRAPIEYQGVYLYLIIYKCNCDLNIKLPSRDPRAVAVVHSHMLVVFSMLRPAPSHYRPRYACEDSLANYSCNRGADKQSDICSRRRSSALCITPSLDQ